MNVQLFHAGIDGLIDLPAQKTGSDELPLRCLSADQLNTGADQHLIGIVAIHVFLDQRAVFGKQGRQAVKGIGEIPPDLFEERDQPHILCQRCQLFDRMAQPGVFLSIEDVGLCLWITAVCHQLFLDLILYVFDADDRRQSGFHRCRDRRQKRLIDRLSLCDERLADRLFDLFPAVCLSRLISFDYLHSHLLICIVCFIVSCRPRFDERFAHGIFLLVHGVKIYEHIICVSAHFLLW